MENQEKKPRTKLTTKTIEEVARLYDEGMKQTEIAKKVGISYASVGRIVHNGKNANIAEVDAEAAEQGTTYGKYQAAQNVPSVTIPQTEKPAPTITAPAPAADTLSPRDVRILRALTEQIIRVLAVTEGEQVTDDHALESALGMLTAVQMILGEDDGNI